MPWDQNEEDPEQIKSILRARHCVSGDTAGVIVGNHGDDAGPQDGEVESIAGDWKRFKTMDALANPIHRCYQVMRISCQPKTGVLILIL